MIWKSLCHLEPGSEPARQEMGKSLCGDKTHFNVSVHCRLIAFLESSESKSLVCELGDLTSHASANQQQGSLEAVGGAREVPVCPPPHFSPAVIGTFKMQRMMWPKER